VVLALAVVGASMAWWSMPNSAVPSNDSWFYIGVARNLTSEGAGLTSPYSHELTGLSPSEAVAGIGRQPITAWPPLYPVALAAGSPVSLTIESTARLLNVVGLAAVTALIGALVLRLGGSCGAAVAAGLTFTAGISTVLTFALAGSEPLYLALQLGALVVAGTLARRVTIARILAFVVLAACASSTRYVGLAVVVTGVVMVATTSAPLDRARRAGATALTALAGLPTVVWLLRVRSTPGFRSGPAYENRLGDLPAQLRSVGEWFVPPHVLDGWRGPLVAVVVLAAAGAAAYAFLRPAAPADTPDPAPVATVRAPGSPDRRLAVTLVLHAVLYEVLVLASASSLDHMIPLGYRLTLPLAPSLLALLVAGIDLLLRRVPTRAWRYGAFGLAAAVSLLVVGIQFQDSYDRVLSRSPEGLWSNLPEHAALERLDQLPDDTVIFTNQPSAIYALTGRPVLALPLQRSPMTGAPNPGFDGELDDLARRVGDGAVVVIDRSSAFFTDGIITSEADLGALVDLEVVAEDPTFVVLRASS